MLHLISDNDILIEVFIFLWVYRVNSVENMKPRALKEKTQRRILRYFAFYTAWTMKVSVASEPLSSLDSISSLNHLAVIDAPYLYA